MEIHPEPDIDNVDGRIIKSRNHATQLGSNRHTSQVLYSAQEGSVFDNEKQNMNRLHWMHNPNDAIGWHHNYRPSDLTNVENSHDNYYPRHNVDSMSQQTEDTQQSKPFDFNQQETRAGYVRRQA